MIELANKKHSFERGVYNVYTLLADVGGFNVAIGILPTFFMSWYAQKMYAQ